MKKTTYLATSAVALATLALLGCSSVQDKIPADTLVAVKVGAAPNMDALASDGVWANAKPLNVKLSGGRNLGGKGETSATLKAVYSGDMLYMLLQYSDPTNSVRRGPYQKQADGSWTKLKDPADKGGDDNLYYEDKWAMIWNISVKDFETQGCASLCHEGQTKPYGNKYTPGEGQLADMWHMKGSRTAPMGFVDDQYVDDTRYDPKTAPNAGRKGDPGAPGGEYNAFPLVNGKPQFMSKSGLAATAGGTYYVKRGDEVAFDDSKFKAGDEVASYIVNPLIGDRGDVRIATKWNNGMHTAVISRKLVTGSKFDVQFNDLGKRYAFGLAAFDNAQVRHATADETLSLVFAR